MNTLTTEERKRLVKTMDEFVMLHHQGCDDSCAVKFLEDKGIEALLALINEERLKSDSIGYERGRQQEGRGCPCYHVEPCSSQCSCANEFISGGCQRCCKYGSKEQQLSAAKRIQTLSQGGKKL